MSSPPGRTSGAAVLANRRRLKIGGEAADRHSRAPSRFAEPREPLQPRVAGDDTRARSLERHRFPTGRGAGVVHLIAWRDRREPSDERVGGILDDPSTFRETGKIRGKRDTGNAGPELETGAPRRLLALESHRAQLPRD